MTGAEHYLEAERLISSVHLGTMANDPVRDDKPHIIAAAQVHATLATLAAADSRDVLDRDDLRSGMAEAIERFGRNLGFTAPELWGMRVGQLKSELLGLLSDDDEDGTA